MHAIWNRGRRRRLGPRRGRALGWVRALGARRGWGSGSQRQRVICGRRPGNGVTSGELCAAVIGTPRSRRHHTACDTPSQTRLTSAAGFEPGRTCSTAPSATNARFVSGAAAPCRRVALVLSARGWGQRARAANTPFCMLLLVELGRGDRHCLRRPNNSKVETRSILLVATWSTWLLP